MHVLSDHFKAAIDEALKWEDVLGMPHDFSEFRYRVAQ